MLAGLGLRDKTWGESKVRMVRYMGSTGNEDGNSGKIQQMFCFIPDNETEI